MLTPKQNKFIDEYMIDLNATQAAIRAGYSKKTAHSIGSENLTKPEVIDEIKRRQEEDRKKAEVTKEEVVIKVKELLHTTDFNPVHTTNLKAAEFLAKMFGYDSSSSDDSNSGIDGITIEIIPPKK